ncbi:MAG: translocation/assembly module TamB domain-containing protein [Rhizobacter sp.]|nr:translocation/assembly module TamB domain-containing protein [Ferruginibacter sp.]
MASPKQVLRKVGKGFLYLLIGVLGLVAILLIFINTNWGKKTVKNQVVSYLEKQLKTKVSIGSVDYSLPQWIELNNIYVEDQKKDTLLFGEKLKVNISMFKLLRGNTDIQKVDLQNILINLKRPETDSVFNYEFVINAFTGNKSTTAEPDTAEMKITLDEIIFNRVNFRMDDQFAGNKFSASIQDLKATFDKFQPDRLNFGINQFDASGVNFLMRTNKASFPDTSVAIITDSAKQTATYGLYINANRFAIKNAVVDIANTVSGMIYKNDVKQIKLTQVLFNIEQSIATADSLLLDTGMVQFKSAIAVKQIKSINDSAKAPAAPWLIKANKININHIAAKYDDSNLPAKEGFDPSHLDVKNINTHISSFLFSADTTRAYVSQLTMEDKSGLKLDTAHVNFTFTNQFLLADQLYIKTPNSLIQNWVSLTYDSLAGITINPQNSLLKATLVNSTIAFNDLYILLPTLKTSFKPAEFANKKVNFNTEIRGNLQRVYLPFLQLNGLDGSSLSARGTLYNLTDAKKFSYDLYIDQSRILKSDLLKFIPPENQAQLAQLPAVINLRGRFNGSTNNIVADVSTVTPDLSFSGRVSLTNLQDPTKLQYDLSINSASVGKRTIMGFIPPGKLPPNIQLPDRINASGKFKGTANGFDADMKLNTSLGNMTVKGYLQNFADPNRARYDIALGTAGFNLGKFISQDSILGAVSGNFKAKGTGFDIKTMNSTILADINALQYNRYTYRNANIAADLNDGIINSKGTINDSNLVLQYELAANTQSKYPSLVGFIDVDTARMQAMNLMKDTLNFSLYANLDAKNTTPGALDIMAVIDSIRMQTSQGIFVLDTVALTGTSENGMDDIHLKSPFAYMHARGAFDYDQVGQSMINYINNYYPVAAKQAAPPTKEQQVAFELVIADHPLVKAFVPGLVQYDSITLKGNYASANTDSALNLSARMPLIQYGDLRVSQGALDINSKEGKLNYAVKVDTLQNANLQFFGTAVSGAAAKDSISFLATTQDKLARDWFAISADMYQKEAVFNFRLKDTLLLNYEDWSVAKDNFISYGPEGILVNNFLIQSDTASIAAKSQAPVPNSPIDIKIDNFNLKSISSLVSGDTLFASGILDANVLVSELNKSFPAFTGTTSVTNLVVMMQPVGDINGSAQKISDDLISGKIALTGNGNDVQLAGNYFLTDHVDQFNADLNVNRLNVATLQGFAAGQLKNSSGNINGQVKLNGKFDNPQWNGFIGFDTTQFTLTAFGAPYKLNNQKISLNYPTIQFNNFTIKDSLNHDLVIDGSIQSKSMTEYNLNLKINADDFIVMNAKKSVDNELYGFASIDANMEINGSSAAPKMEGSVKLNDKSNVTLVLPETNYQKDEGISVVKFIDTDTFDVYKPPVQFVEAKKAKATFGQYLNYNFNIAVSKNATFTIVIDPTTGDEIEVQGDASLNAGVDPGGNLVLAGNYELEKGHYNFSYQFLSRKFDLVKGSSIQFAGAPMDARINITATYTIETDSRGLLGNEITSTSGISNLLNQKVPYNVVMNLTGVLTRPQIKFSITLPDGTANVNSDLKTTIDGKLAQLSSDEAAMNKQVFSLLLFGRFAGEQSSDFFKGNGTDFSDIARQSVSQFLSSALDNIAGDLIKGVDIDLALNTYEDFNTTGSQQRTDLNLALSKKFLNDRLTITVGKNFGLQGQDAESKANAASGSQYIPDFSADYQLSKDGRYRIRGYRKNAYEAVLDGYVIESGVSFVVTLDYEKFRELFQRRKKVKKAAPAPAVKTN